MYYELKRTVRESFEGKPRESVRVSNRKSDLCIDLETLFTSGGNNDYVNKLVD